MRYSAKPNSRNAAYRRIIAGLVQALCDVPEDVREEWAGELLKKKREGEMEDLSPDEFVVMMTLANLNVFNRVANDRREEEKPKLYPIVGRETVRRRGTRPASEASLSSRGDLDGPPHAA